MQVYSLQYLSLSKNLCYRVTMFATTSPNPSASTVKDNVKLSEAIHSDIYETQIFDGPFANLIRKMSSDASS